MLLGDPIEIDSPQRNGGEICTRSRTRSGKAFGDIQERSESSNDVDDDSMEEDDGEETGGWGAGELGPPGRD